MGTCKRIKRVTIVPGCISCGTCEAVCPDVFEVKGIAEVRPNPDVITYAEAIYEAADLCPVSVIKVDSDES